MQGIVYAILLLVQMSALSKARIQWSGDRVIPMLAESDLPGMPVTGWILIRLEISAGWIRYLG